MKVLIVSQYFWPENFRINDLTLALEELGHDLTVLTGKPNYPNGIVFPEYINNKSKFTKYGNASVVRVPLIPRGQSSRSRLLLNYLSFAFSAAIYGAWKLRKEKFDVIFVFEPSPITVGLPAIFLKWLKDAPIVFWVLDLWPDSLKAVGAVKSKIGLNIVGKMVSYIYNSCDLVLGQSRSFCQQINSYCSSPSKIRYFPSWAEDIYQIDRTSTGEPLKEYDSCFKILFAGNIGEAQDFPSLISSALELKKKGRSDIKFFIVGDGRLRQWTQQQVNRNGLEDMILFMGRHPLERMPSFYKDADALLVTLKSSDVFSKTIPGKVQSYMFAGKPIIALLDGEGAEVIRQAGAGLVANAGDYKSLAANIERLSTMTASDLAKMGVNAKKYARKEFDRTNLIKQLEQMFISLQGSSDKHHF